VYCNLLGFNHKVFYINDPSWLTEVLKGQTGVPERQLQGSEGSAG